MNVTRKLLKPIRGKAIGETVRISASTAKRWEAEGIVAKGEPVEGHHEPSPAAEPEGEAAADAEQPPAAAPRVPFWRRRTT